MPGTDNSGRLPFGFALVALAILFLAAQAFGLSIGRYLWPAFVLLPGLLLFMLMMLLGRSAAPLAIPGSIVTTVSLILFTQSVMGHFASWAYAWALIPTAVGVGHLIWGSVTERDDIQRVGSSLVGLGLILFFSFGVFFELLIFSGVTGLLLGKLLLPGALIGGGMYVLVRKGRRDGARFPPT